MILYLEGSLILNSSVWCDPWRSLGIVAYSLMILTGADVYNENLGPLTKHGCFMVFLKIGVPPKWASFLWFPFKPTPPKWYQLNTKRHSVCFGRRWVAPTKPTKPTEPFGYRGSSTRTATAFRPPTQERRRSISACCSGCDSNPTDPQANKA